MSIENKQPPLSVEQNQSAGEIPETITSPHPEPTEQPEGVFPGAKLLSRVKEMASATERRFDTWAGKRVEAMGTDPDSPRFAYEKSQLVIGVGILGTAALYFAAPAAAHQVMETIQTGGNNFANPGLDKASIGEFVSVGAASGALGYLHYRWLNRGRSSEQPTTSQQ